MMDDETGTGRNRSFSSLGIDDFRKLFISGVFAFLAVGFQLTARAWLAIQLTDSVAALGGVMLAFGGSMLLVTPIGGVAADRVSRRLVIVVAHVGLTASAGIIGLAVVVNLDNYPLLVATSALQGVSFALLAPSRIAYTAAIVPARQLPNALSLTQLSISATQVIGPSLAGVLIAAPGFGVGGTFLLSAGLTFIGIFPVVALGPANPPTREASSPLRDLGNGLRYIRRSRSLRQVLAATLLMIFIAYPYTVFVPKVVEDLYGLGSGWLGILFAANAVGGTVASLYCARLSSAGSIQRTRTLGAFGVPIGVVLFGLAPNEWTALPVLVFLGAAAMAFQTMSMTLSLMLSGEEYHGRVQSVLMIAWSGSAITSLPLGALADAIGLRALHYLMGAAGIGVAVGLLVSGQTRARPSPPMGEPRPAR